VVEEHDGDIRFKSGSNHVERHKIKMVIMEKTVSNSCNVVTVTNVDTGNAQVLKQFIPTFFNIFTEKTPTKLTKYISFDNVNKQYRLQRK